MVKKVRGKSRTTNGASKKPSRKPSKKQAIRRSIQSKLQKRLAEGVKLTRELEKQRLGPDEIAARVRARLEGLGNDVVADILTLVGGSIHIQMP